MVAKRGLKGLKGLKDLRLSPGVERMDTGQVVHYTDQRDTTKGTATPQRKRRKYAARNTAILGSFGAADSP